MTFGVTPAGFNRKPLAEILAELESANVATFGPQVVQTSVSPLGQLNGMLADLISTEWEYFEDLYQSFDPDQAEGRRLDILARFRILTRADGESDLSLRQAITNADRARIDMEDLKTALEGIAGVTYVAVYVNEEATTDANGIPPNTVAVAIIGGDDDDIALTVRRYVVPGIGTYGNEVVRTVINGFCRQIKIIRPVAVPMDIEIDVIPGTDNGGCPPPSALTIATGLLAELSNSATRPRNGQDGTEHLFRRAVECRYPGIEVDAVRVARVPDDPTTPPEPITFFEIMTFAIDKIAIITV